MATLTFGGTTIWNDAGTGKGRPERNITPDKELTSFRVLPGNGALVATNLGTQYGGASFSLQYWLRESESQALETTLQNLKNTTGQVVYTVNSVTEWSHSNCKLTDSRLVSTGVQCNDGSNHRIEYVLTIQFQKLGA